MWVPQEELLGVPAASSTDSIPTSFHSQMLRGLIFLALKSEAGGPDVSLGLLIPEISLPNFYPSGCRASPFHIHTPPTSVYGYGFLNSIVVRLPFNPISGDPCDGCSVF